MVGWSKLGRGRPTIRNDVERYSCAVPNQERQANNGQTSINGGERIDGRKKDRQTDRQIEGQPVNGGWESFYDSFIVLCAWLS